MASWGFDLKFDWSSAGKFSIHHFIPPSESSTFCQSHKKGQTAHFFAPLSFFHQKPEALHLYLNFLCHHNDGKTKENEDRKIQTRGCGTYLHKKTQHWPNPALPEMFVTFILYKYFFFISDATHGDYCALNSVAPDLPLDFVSHPLALSGIPRMRPGRAGRVFPLTPGPPRSPPTTTRSHPAATRRWTTGTDPCQPSAPGEDRLYSQNKHKQLEASDCEMSRLSTWQPCSKCSAYSSNPSFQHGAAAMRHLFQFLLTTN